jgi:Dyp-type peroxidase family
MSAEPIREAPAPGPLQCGLTDDAHPDVVEIDNPEPVLRVDNIQGNILGGFSKDFQTLLFFKINNAAQFKAYLKTIIPLVATSAEVISFNRLFKALRDRRRDLPPDPDDEGESSPIKATWLNIAFSFEGLRLLTPTAAGITDEAFKQGLAARSAQLGDPTDPHSEGHPDKWKVGGTHTDPVHAVLIIASDDKDDLERQVKRFKTELNKSSNGTKLVFEQPGANLPKKMGLGGHEHFGFLDGVSQPGLRGRLSDEARDVLTVRQTPATDENPENRFKRGKPGQDLLWPGEFVLGYPKQNPEPSDEPGEEGELNTDPGEIATAGPEWTTDGSFLVFRRLRQDVGGFHKFLKDEAAKLGTNPLFPDMLGARLVGRWRSGAPVIRTPSAENPELAKDDCANNNFEFRGGAEEIPAAAKTTPFDCSDDQTPPYGIGDLTGERCPFAGHIRKAYPRDDKSDTSGVENPDAVDCHSRRDLNESNTQTHRLLRRGIPFGEASKSTPNDPKNDSKDRGLLFLAYQTDIARQFEFVTSCWVNNPDFKEIGAGHDPIIGQNNLSPDRKRHFKVNISGAERTLETKADWVIPTGGGYFFAPSIKALNETLSK